MSTEMPVGAETDAKLAVREALPGVRELERRRGEEQVRFRHVADHLVDFAAHHPDCLHVMDELGAYLAAVESTDHDHDAPAGSTGG